MFNAIRELAAAIRENSAIAKDILDSNAKTLAARAVQAEDVDDLRELVLRHDVELGINANQLRLVAELLNRHGNRLTIVEVELAAHCAKQRHERKKPGKLDPQPTGWVPPEEFDEVEHAES